MKKLILMLTILVAGMVQAQEFDFECPTETGYETDAYFHRSDRARGTELSYFSNDEIHYRVITSTVAESGVSIESSVELTVTTNTETRLLTIPSAVSPNIFLYGYGGIDALTFVSVTATVTTINGDVISVPEIRLE